MKKFRIIQRRDKCIGCGACKEVAPGRWQMSTLDGKGILLGARQKRNSFSVVVDETEISESVSAMRTCPVGIIEIVEL